MNVERRKKKRTKQNMKNEEKRKQNCRNEANTKMKRATRPNRFHDTRKEQPPIVRVVVAVFSISVLRFASVLSNFLSMSARILVFCFFQNVFVPASLSPRDMALCV